MLKSDDIISYKLLFILTNVNKKTVRILYNILKYTVVVFSVFIV